MVCSRSSDSMPLICSPSRPSDGEKRVEPSSLEDYRRTHEFLGPCCLCPLFEPEGRTIFTEASLCIAPSGQFCGEYVAQCAKGACGYLGKPNVPLDRGVLTFALFSATRRHIPQDWSSLEKISTPRQVSWASLEMIINAVCRC